MVYHLTFCARGWSEWLTHPTQTGTHVCVSVVTIRASSPALSAASPVHRLPPTPMSNTDCPGLHFEPVRLLRSLRWFGMTGLAGQTLFLEMHVGRTSLSDATRSAWTRRASASPCTKRHMFCLPFPFRSSPLPSPSRPVRFPFAFSYPFPVIFPPPFPFPFVFPLPFPLPLAPPLPRPLPIPLLLQRARPVPRGAAC